MHNSWNYRKDEDGTVYRFPFPRDQRRNMELLKGQFRMQGLEVADVQYELTFLTWVLTTNGALYCMDTSHGGGGVFVLEQK